MRNRDRNQSGRFTGSSTTRPRPAAADFDLLASLRTLFRTAEKAADFTGAASIARVLRDMDEGDQGRDEDVVLKADDMTLEERQEVRDLLLGYQLLRNRVLKRLGREELPVPQHLYERLMPPGPPREYALTTPAPPKPEPVAENPIAVLTTPTVEEVDPFGGCDANRDCESGPPRFITRRQP